MSLGARAELGVALGEIEVGPITEVESWREVDRHMRQTTKKTAAKSTPTNAVDDYLAAAPKDQRAALTRLRRTIKAAAPKATEGIRYGIAGFTHDGKPLLHFGYWKAHCALYGSFDAHAVELKAYDLSKGTIRFPAEKPLPDRLVTKIVKARIAEIERAGKGSVSAAQE
jgi:uncharacterized protein YdhG (YjbR/CyaY superfamily)